MRYLKQLMIVKMKLPERAQDIGYKVQEMGGEYSKGVDVQNLILDN